MEDDPIAYSTIATAKEQIWERWNNIELRRKVDEYIGNHIPLQLKEGPRAILVRTVMTPDIEFHHFLKLARDIQLKPLGFEYLNDTYYTINSDKLALTKITFLQNKKAKSGKIVEQYEGVKIIDYADYEGKRFREIMSKWGENLVDMHHRMLTATKEPIEYVDMSSFYTSKGGDAKSYYPHLMSFFVCRGVLFENFVTDKHELKFANEVVKPAIEIVRNKFGFAPLVVPIAPKKDAHRKYWWCYQSSIRKVLYD